MGISWSLLTGHRMTLVVEMGRLLFWLYSVMGDFVDQVCFLRVLLDFGVLHVVARQGSLPLARAILAGDRFGPGVVAAKNSLTAQGGYRLVQAVVIRMICIMMVGLAAFLGLGSTISGADFTLGDVLGDLLLVQAELNVGADGFRSHVGCYPLIQVGLS